MTLRTFGLGLIASASIVGCTRSNAGNPLLPNASVPLATMQTPMFTTGVPAGWTVNFMGPRQLKAFDPNSQSQTSTAELQFTVQVPNGPCEGEKLETNEGSSCVKVMASKGDRASGNVVELQTPVHNIRLTHSVGELDKPVPVEELKALAIRIVNTYAPPPTPAAAPTAEASISESATR